MTRSGTNIEDLLRRAGQGDAAARGQLLEQHRARLRRMVACRMDPRLAARVDPSDVVQDTLVEADRRLDDYLRQQPLPFYPWLRQLAWDRLIEQHRRHLRAERRSVLREQAEPFDLGDQSALELADRLLDSGQSPSAAAQREELRLRMRAVLDGLLGPDREVLMLRYLEQMSAAEVAAVLGIGEAAAKKRFLRALHRLRQSLGDRWPEEHL
jgi:RNA polymerase sigma-70 factor (ECF subfamily)